MNMFWRKQRERGLERELRAHLELEAEEQADLYAARRALGNTTHIQEEVRAVWGGVVAGQVWQDIRYAVRTLRAAPAFTAVAFASLALGIGANTAIFELIDAVRLRNLPVPHPEQLARIQIRGGNSNIGLSDEPFQLTYPLFREIRRQQQAFSKVLAWNSGGDSFILGEGAQARYVPGIEVSGDFFATLGIQPAAGRLLTAADDQPGCAAPGVVLSYSFWQTEFGGQTSAIGRRLTLQDHSFEVIGVTPANFSGLEVGKRFDLALPICVEGILNRRNDEVSMQRTDVYWLSVIGRLKPGWTVAKASAYLKAITPPLLEATLPRGYSHAVVDQYRQFRLEAVPAGNGISPLRGEYGASLWLLLGITGMVLLIACLNLANLMLARSTARQQEFAVRLALGASRWRLVRQALCESVLLACSGAVLGLALSLALSGLIPHLLSTEDSPLYLEMHADGRVWAFTAAVALATCLLFGVMPAWRTSHAEPGAAMKAGARSLTAGRDRFSFQRWLVVVQIGTSMVLLAGALLFVKSFRNLMTLDLGFRQSGIVLAAFDSSRLHLSDTTERQFEGELLQEVRQLPHVQAAASTTTVQVGGGVTSLIVQAGAVDRDARFTWVSPGHFSLLDIPMLAGRDFEAADTRTSPKVAIVNQTFIRTFLGNGNPIGRSFRTSPEPDYPATEYQIVGVVRDTKYFDLRQPVPSMVYAPATQYPVSGPWTMLYVRSQAPPATVIANIRRWLAISHPGVTPVFHVLQTQIADGLVRERLMATVSGFFGVLAALLAAVGLYGVIAYILERRRNEIGIRMALGADAQTVLAMVLRQAAGLLLIGLVLGSASALALTRTAASLLFGLSAHDPATFVTAGVLLAAAAAMGSYLPARQASKLDPITALRCE